MGERNNLFNIKPGDTLSFGVIKAATGVQFSVYLPDEKNCKLKFYYIGRKEPACVIPLTEEFKRGGVYFVVVTGINSEDKDGRSIMQVLSQDFEYMYEADGKEFIFGMLCRSQRAHDRRGIAGIRCRQSGFGSSAEPFFTGRK